MRFFSRHLGRRSATLYGALGLVAAAAALFAANSVYGFLDASASGASVQRTATVGRGTVQSSVTASGNVSVATSSSANFTSSGTLTEVDVAAGDKVEAGQVLAKIDPSSAEVALQSAQANLEQAQSTLATAEAGLTDAQKASNAVSLQNAQAQATSAKQQLASDKSALSAANKQLAQDEALNCPPFASTSSGSNGAISSADTTSATAGGSTAAAAATAGSGTGSTADGSTTAGSQTASRNGVEVAAAGPTGESAPAASTTTPTATSTAPTTTSPTTTTTPTTTTSAATTTSATSTTTTTTTTSPGSVPSAVTGQVSNIGSATATLSGTVNPSGAETTYVFEYGTSSSALDSKAGTGDAGSVTGSVSVTASASGLKPGRAYYVRLVATNAKGTVDGAVETFATVPAAMPTVATSAATSVLTTTATLTGTVDPNGSDTTYHFQYGTSTGYGSQTAQLDAGSGTAAVEVTASIGGLKAGTAYLFRLVATNGSGTSTGIAQVLDTAASSCVDDKATIKTDEQAIQQEASAVATAETSLTQTTATIAESESPSTTTIAQDEAAVSQAKATVDADQKALDQTTLKAPAAGTVTAVNGSVGDTVDGSGSSSAQSSANTAGSQGAGGTGAATTGTSATSSTSSAFVTIDSLDKLQVVAGFAEADATKLAVGDPATVTLSALPNVEVAGKVVAVSTTSTVVSNVVTYATTISLVNPPADVKEGMTASVSVVVESRTNVLELPSAAITTTGAASTVEVLQNGKTTTSPVQVGLVGSSSTQIVGGLQNGAVVVIPTVSVSSATSSTATGAGLAGGGLGGAGFAGGAGAGRAGG